MDRRLPRAFKPQSLRDDSSNHIGAESFVANVRKYMNAPSVTCHQEVAPKKLDSSRLFVLPGNKYGNCRNHG
jgi:hypothetical protein